MSLVTQTGSSAGICNFVICASVTKENMSLLSFALLSVVFVAAIAKVAFRKVVKLTK